ncbi:restriction endonuclease subunit S [Oceanimonas smirnovii]|uniref:restriction endonuclease subunit S n=1 Tax=Oceanimonas smirnovii TaxID=264574 RepID=UPI003AAF058E
MLPEGWKLEKLGDIAVINPSRSEKPLDGKVSFIPMDAVSESAKILRLDARDYSEVSKGFTSFKNDDVIVAKITPCFENGKGAYLEGLRNGVGFGSTEFHVIRAGYKADARFLFYLTRTSEFRVRGERNMQGSAGQKRVTTDYIKLYKVLTPPLPEQKKIAQILSTWDNAISATERLLENSQQRKKALMQQLLTGKKRLPGFEGEWRKLSLGSLFKRVLTRNNGQSDNVVTISGQHGLISQKEFFKKSVASEILDGYYLLVKGQFAYNKSYSNGYPMGAIKRLNRYENGVVTTLYICFELIDESNVCGDFFEQYFESGILNRGISQIAHEGGRAHGLLNVKPSDFFSLRIFIPELEEQQAIANVLTTADQEIDALQKRLGHLKQEKKALMQQLLTGKRRVQVDAAA